jgi:hypothetical protein
MQGQVVFREVFSFIELQTFPWRIERLLNLSVFFILNDTAYYLEVINIPKYLKYIVLSGALKHDVIFNKVCISKINTKYSSPSISLGFSLTDSATTKKKNR